MKSTVIIGLVLIIFGIGVLAYKGINYTTQEKVAQIGDVQITAEKEKSIYFPPILGGASIVVGVILVIAGGRNKLK